MMSEPKISQERCAAYQTGCRAASAAYAATAPGIPIVGPLAAGVAFAAVSAYEWLASYVNRAGGD
jgi:hypothetical protein